MYVQNHRFHTYPAVLHFPGRKSEEQLAFFEHLQDWYFSEPAQKFKTPSSLTIMTWNSEENEKGLLERSLRHLGMKHRVLGRGKKDWLNVDKIPITYDALKEVKTEFVMVMDNYDVLVLRKLKEMLDEFADSGSGVIFNASNFDYGLRSSAKIERALYFEHEMKHLNSGVFLGRTTFLLKFFEVCCDLMTPVAKATQMLGERADLIKDDQSVIKLASILFYPWVQLDHRCHYFQVVNGRTLDDLTVHDWEP